MRLQKHERLVIDYARKLAPDLTITVTSQGHSKRRLTLTGSNGSRSITMASSPKNRDHAIINNKRWIDQTIPTVRLPHALTEGERHVLRHQARQP